MSRRQTLRRYLLRIVIGATLLVGLGFGASAGWQHITSRPCTLINLQGVRYADSQALEAMIRDTMDANIVADRLRRHPWVRSSSAVCYPTGMLHVWVEERVPRALVMSETGEPDYFIDRAGYMMPVDSVMAFDVPLIHYANVPYRPLEPASHDGLRDLLEMLPGMDESVDALISEFIFTDDGLELITRPTPAGPAVRVNLGRDAWSDRLDRLHVFWRQQVTHHPNRQYESVDLRFNGQIVTRESSI